MTKRRIKSWIFVIVVFVLICASLIVACLGLNPINEYENRTAEFLPKWSVEDFLSGVFQDNTELGLADQIPFAEDAKKLYNSVQSNLVDGLIEKSVELSSENTSWNNEEGINNDLVAQYALQNVPFYMNKSLNQILLPPNFHDNRFYALTDVVSIYNGHLVAEEHQIDDEEKDCPLVQAVNKLSSIKDLSVYYYCVERERDVNIVTGERNRNHSILSDAMNLSTFNKGCFSVDSFELFDQLFYKTDHHWNNKGSYIGYCQIMKMMKGNEKPLYPVAEYLIGDGKGSRSLGTAQSYAEYFSVYEYDFPEFEYWHSGKKVDNIGIVEESIESAKEGKAITYLNYLEIYGEDSGEVIIRNKESKGNGNILIFADSYDNAIQKLIASHYDNLYSLDIRYYKRDLDKEFDVYDYIEKNNIDTVLFLCATEYVYDIKL